jgi:hypothetical protein
VSGELFQTRVQLRAMQVYARHVQGTIEVRALTRGMPGGARGEFPFFNQHHIAPALKGKVIEQANAHGAAADDYYPRMGFHP